MATTRVGASLARTRVTPRQPARASGTWAYAYALHQTASNPTDGLILVYAALIGMRPTGVAAVDAIGSVGSVLGLLTVGWMADKLGARRFVLAGLLAAAGAIMIAVAITTRPMPLIGLALIWGFFFAAPNPMASVVITRLFHKSSWSDQQVRLSTLTSLGQAVGMALAIVWLIGAGHFWTDTIAVRLFFVIAAGLSFAAALIAIVAYPKGTSMPSSEGAPASRVMAAPVKPVSSRGPVREAPYNDRFKSLLLITGAMYLGLGMVGTVLPVYLTQELHAKSYMTMIGSFGLVLTATLGLRAIGQGMARLASLRFYAVAIGARGALVLAIGLTALVLPTRIAPYAVIALMPVIGLCSAAISASSSTRLVNLAPAGHKGGASGQYSAVTFVAMTIGAFVGGFCAQVFGFLPAFALAAGWLFIASALALRL